MILEKHKRNLEAMEKEKYEPWPINLSPVSEQLPFHDENETNLKQESKPVQIEYESSSE